ncbi:MAG: TatD family hydrolase [Bacillota bacterium]
MLIDSHAHLYDKWFDKDRDKVIRGMKKDGIELTIVSGSSVLSAVKAIELANRYDCIYATIGVHPNNTDTMDSETLDTIRELSQNKKVIAIGECGLDYHYDYSPKDVQKKWFIEQIRLAKELKLPVVVHDREANIDTYEILKSEQDGSLEGVLHCYSGDAELASKYVDMGLYISIAGPVTYRSAHKLKEVAKTVPLGYLLIETDAPSLPPSQIGKRRNEPAYVRYVAAAVAELKGIPFERVALETAKNVKRLYKIT